MPSLSHLLLYFLKLRPHAVASGFPFDLELSAAACSADEGEAQKVEGLRFSEPPMSNLGSILLANRLCTQFLGIVAIGAFLFTGT
jgi:hypothetical protein